MAASTAKDVLLLQRFGFGPRMGFDTHDVRGRLHEEIALKRAPLLALAPHDASTILAEVEEFRTETRRKRERTQLEDINRMAEEQGQFGPRMPAPTPGRYSQQVYRDGVAAAITAAVEAPVGFAERLAWFWTNHFAISATKSAAVRAITADYQQTAIRPHIFGRFADMLLASARHPAMLMFLDQRQSIGPNSRAGQRRARGLNENLAREILELHTLGVGGGYTQADVGALARMLTGWTIIGPQDEDGNIGAFTFNQNRHEPGPQTLLGRTYPDTGVSQAETALRDIARHPSTAKFIAAKLARHFIADEPPADLIALLAKVFQNSDGDLAVVSKALIEAPQALAPATKIRSPLEFIAAALRASDSNEKIDALFGPMRAMGQTMWSPGGPNGFADTKTAWVHPEGMKVRMEYAARLARRLRQADPMAMLDHLLGASASQETRMAVMRAESRMQAVAILLMSPEFQKR